MRLTIALGGNAILRPGEKGSYSEQFANVYSTCRQIGLLALRGHEIIVTHGNGPQVGNILIQQEAGSSRVPAMPLDACGSQTQGLIGYMIQNSLFNIFKELDLEKSAAAVVTQVLVDKNDPAFKNPSKPVGPFFAKKHAEKMMATSGETWVEDSGRGWRKVVPSPEPVKIIEAPIINSIIENGEIVIASGGGGIPVIEENRQLKGVEAVIDKDRAGCILAENSSSDLFLILTDVENAMINYGTDKEKKIEKAAVSEMEKYIEQGQFGKGSMKPKVESAVKFVRDGGKTAVITSINKVVEAVEQKAGTIITED
ncbi:MAG: carbamate kinase [Bacillota bacterium]